MYNIIYEMNRQSRFDARYWMLGAGALGRPRGMVLGGRRRVHAWHVARGENMIGIIIIVLVIFSEKHAREF